MPSMASEVEPLPFEFMNFTATSFADQQIPELPLPLLPRPPRSPARLRRLSSSGALHRFRLRLPRRRGNGLFVEVTRALDADVRQDPVEPARQIERRPS